MDQLLIVDDDVLFLQALCAEMDFESIGFTKTYTATSFQEASAILSRQPITVLISDIEMQEKNGLDLVTWVQERQLPVVSILLTCHSSFDYARQAIRLGVIDYLLKPIRSELLYDRLTQVLQQLHRQPQEAGSAESNLIAEIKAYIDRNIHSELTREQLGKEFFMNPDYLARLFRTKTGVRLNTYIRNQRMNRAKKLLMETDLPINIICTQVGYGYNNYFFHTFKEVTGCTPNEFRKETGKEPESPQIGQAYHVKIEKLPE